MPWPSSTTWHPLQYRPWKGQENGFIISKPLQHPSWRYLTRLISSDAHCGIHRLNHRIAWGEQQKHSTLAMTQQSIKSEIWKTIHNCRDSAMTICVYECNSIALLFIADTLKLTRCSFVGLCCLKSSLFNQCMLLKRMIARTSYNWYCARLLLRCVPTKYHHLYFTSLLSSLLFTLLLHHLLCFLRLPSTIIDGSPPLSLFLFLSFSLHVWLLCHLCLACFEHYWYSPSPSNRRILSWPFLRRKTHIRCKRPGLGRSLKDHVSQWNPLDSGSPSLGLLQHAYPTRWDSLIRWYRSER